MPQRHIDSIIIHCSDSTWGDRGTIDLWHRQRGWDGIGYHYVITNGVLVGDEYRPRYDGLIQEGRPLNVAGAHCKGHNAHSVGICLIGRNHFTASQLYEALPSLLGSLLEQYDLPPEAVSGHCEFNTAKTCPNIAPALLRRIARLAAEKKI